MAENFELGFSIDTTALTRAGVEATKAAAAAQTLGNAEQKLASDAQKATGALKDEAAAAKQASTAKEEAANKTNQFGASLQTISGTLRLHQQDLQALVFALSGRGGVGGLLGGLGAAGGALSRLGQAIGPVGLALAGGTAAVAGFGMAAYGAAEKLAAFGDRMTQLEGRLKNSLGSIGAARQAIAGLFESTQTTGLGFQGATDAFARIARNNAGIGMTQREMLQMIDTVQKLGAVSGTSPGEMQAGMVQFGQALASGRLQGDELRSIMENFPALAKAVADNFEQANGKIGITIGELRKMGSEGELTGQKIAEAVLRATETANREFAGLPDTVERANQRLADSYDMLLSTLAKRWEASSFVRSVKSIFLNIVDGARAALDQGTLVDQLVKAEERLERIRKNNVALRSDTASFNGLPANASWGRAAEQSAIAERDRILAQIRAEGEDQARQAIKERELKITATTSSVIARTAELKTFAEETRNAQQTVDDIVKSIAANNTAIAERIGRGEGYDDLTNNIETLANRLTIAAQRAADLKTELGKLQQGLSDRAFATALGGTGGAGFVEQALGAQRADNRRNAGAGLGSYIDVIIRNDLQRNEAQIEQLNRATQASKAMMATIGQSREMVREQEIANEMAAERASFGAFGDPKSKQARADVLEYLDRYDKALRASKLAAEEAADRNKAYQSSIEAMRSGMLAGISNPRDAARAGMEFDISMAVRDMNPEAGAEFAANRRAGYDNNEQRNLNNTMREFEMRAAQMKKEEELVGLIGDERRVQTVLIQKQMELLRQGYREGEEYYETVMANTERLEREAVAQGRRTASVRAIFRQLEDGVQQFEGLFKNTFETIFTHGTRKASDIFLKGMGDMIKKISAQMMYEIAIRPFEVLAQQMATKLGNWLASFLGGGPMPAAANGAWFDGPMYGFAKGGAFTNQIVSRPTLFQFASGTGLMGEAGPEAIMPLKRDSAGRLGVYAQGDGGGVSVVINDMRSAPGAERVETQERRGPNGRRMLSVMIRDEMRRQIRSGDMDREMAGNYGNTRVLARK